MKHAFIIMAHNEFGLLRELVSRLDREGVGIFVHVDSKSGSLPEIQPSKADFHFVNPRLDVRWGHISQVECELKCLREVLDSDKDYDYIHIISGVHLPVSGHDLFDEYFDSVPSAVFQPMETSEKEIAIKIRRFNLCTRTFKSKNIFVERASQMVWRAGNVLQRWFGVDRCPGQRFVKASQWCSLSSSAARYIVSRRAEILKKYRFCLCPDEFFMPTELLNSPLGEGILFRDDYLYQVFDGPSPRVLKKEEIRNAEGFLWARKFSSNG